MKSCPTCNRTYTDASLNFCLEDGTPLKVSAPSGDTPGFDPNETIRYTHARDTGAPGEVPPAATPSYQAAPPSLGRQPSQFGRQQRSTAPGLAPQPRKSSAVWW